jgi:hypothetical protein
LASAGSFLGIDKPNVVCTTIKPAEANGPGIILRFHETQGTATSAAVTIPFVGKITAATETSLIEDDRLVPLTVRGDDQMALGIGPFGVKTVRVVSAPREPAPTATQLKATPVSDMEVDLAWHVDAARAGDVSRYDVYRGTKPDFAPSLLHLVGGVPKTTYRDRPQLHYGGWINNRLEPSTTYYYRIAAVDRWNNRGPVSPPAAAATLKSTEKNALPLRVECLRAVLVSPLSRHNYVNLLFRTNCESDVRRYEIHRFTRPDFTPGDAARIGIADADAVIKGSTAYGHAPIDRRMGEYDHMMYQDETVAPATTYFYRVCAVDTAGQKGPFSPSASVRTKDAAGPAGKAKAQSIYSAEYGPELAIDGDPDPYAAWVSAPYGGGTRQKPRDVWLVVEFPNRIRVPIRGVKIVGDHRDVIPLQKNLQIQARDGGDWKTVAGVKGAATKDVAATWNTPVTTEAVRVFVPAADLPRSDNAAVDGIVRVCELLILLPGGEEIAVADLVSRMK